MIKKLNRIIKIYNKQLDLKKLELKSLTGQEKRLNTALDKLKNHLQQEQLIVTQFPEIHYMYNHFATLNIEKQNLIINDLENLYVKLNNLREEIFILFATIKKYEHLLHNKKENIAKELAKKEEEALENINLNRFNNSSW